MNTASVLVVADSSSLATATKQGKPFERNYTSTKYSHYFAAYDAEFSKVATVRCILEIGVAGGGSLHHWKQQYPEAMVFGIDVDPLCRNCEAEGIKVFIGDQSHTEFMKDVVERIPSPDIIIDDGGHWPFMQRRSLAILWPKLRCGGCYCVEDLHTSYRVRWGGLFGGFLRNAKSYIDDLNCHWHNRPATLKNLSEVVFKDSMVFFHKGFQNVPRLVTTGTIDCRGVTRPMKSSAVPMVKFRISRAFSSGFAGT